MLTSREKEVLDMASYEYWRGSNTKCALSCIFSATDHLNIYLNVMSLIHIERLVMHGEDDTGGK